MRINYMKPPITKFAVTIVLFSVICAMTCVARLVVVWPYEKLVAESDLVAIVEPIENKPAQDTFPEYSYGQATNEFTATDTRFKVDAVLKGDAMKELTVLHFSYSTNVSIILGGPSFIQFYTGPLQYERRAVKNGKPVGGVTSFRQPPEWIAFLKRRSDGRFEPITGHYDPAYSFRELHTTSFYTN
jgi:hypothetical protein